MALAAGAFLLPWCVVLGMTLPASTRVPDWSLAWMGLDFAEAVLVELPLAAAAIWLALALTRKS